MRLRPINLRDLGAVGKSGYETQDHDAWVLAAGRATGRGDVIAIDPCEEQYHLDFDFFSTLAAGRGCKTELKAMIETEVPLVLPREHWIEGNGRALRDGSQGAIIRADSAAFPVAGDIVRFGATDVACHGTKLSHLLIDGNSVDQVRAVYSNSLQEMSGCEHIIVQACNAGFVFNRTGASTNRPNNFEIHDCEIYLIPALDGSVGYALYVHNGYGPVKSVRITASVSGLPATPTPLPDCVLFSLHGHSIKVEDCHTESSYWGLEVGGDGLEETALVEINGFTGFNPTTIEPMQALIRLRSTNAIRSFSAHNIGINPTTPINTVNLIQDDRNSVSLAATTYQRLGRDAYVVEDYYPDTAMPLNIKSSGNNAIRNATLAAGVTADYDLLNTGTLRATVDGGGSTTAGFIGGYTSREVLLINVSGGNWTLPHEDAVNEATASRRISTVTGAAIVLAPREMALMKYGIGPTTARWYMRKL